MTDRFCVRCRVPMPSGTAQICAVCHAIETVVVLPDDQLLFVEATRAYWRRMGRLPIEGPSTLDLNDPALDPWYEILAPWLIAGPRQVRFDDIAQRLGLPRRPSPEDRERIRIIVLATGRTLQGRGWRPPQSLSTWKRKAAEAIEKIGHPAPFRIDELLSLINLGVVGRRSQVLLGMALHSLGYERVRQREDGHVVAVYVPIGSGSWTSGIAKAIEGLEPPFTADTVLSRMGIEATDGHRAHLGRQLIRLGYKGRRKNGLFLYDRPREIDWKELVREGILALGAPSRFVLEDLLQAMKIDPVHGHRVIVGRELNAMGYKARRFRTEKGRPVLYEESPPPPHS